MIRTLLVALVAAGFALPNSLGSCCANPKGKSCCCHKEQQPSTRAAVAKRCCRDSQPSAPAAPQACATHTCVCCQESPPQNTAPERVADRLPTDLGLVAPVAVLPVAESTLDLHSLVASTNAATAIPHRILHCSWLI
jgi:hypothetical protein